MKKTFKFIISAIICLALLIVPMTVMAEEGIDYNIKYDVSLTEGTSNYPIDTTVPYTVYILYPSEVGEFTITSSNSIIGIVSYQDMWVQIEPTAETVNANELKWSCTDVNQAIMIAALPNASEVTLTITRENLDTSNEVEWTVFENATKPESFVMPSFVDVDAFEDGYVDFEDSKIDDAVLGDDGYYHLNDKNGPVLFINLNDPIMSLYTMVGYGKLAAIYYDDAGDVVKKVEYTNAFNEYVSALPTDDTGAITSFYYPLTADLIEIFKEVGRSNGWYDGAGAFVYDSDDAWMFACYYDENVTSMDENANDNTNTDNKDDSNKGDDSSNKGEASDDNDNNNNTNNNNGQTTGGSNGSNGTNDSSKNDANTDKGSESPKTGDSIVNISIAMICATAVVLGSKRK